MNKSSQNLNKQQRGWIYALAVILICFSLACAMPALRSGETTAPTSAAQAIQPETRSATAQVITPGEQSPGLTPTATPEPTPTRQPLPPALVEADPPVGSELPLTQAIKLYFNQAMDQQSVQAGVKLTNFPDTKFEWLDDASLSIQPAQPLAPDSSLTIQIEAPARSASGMDLAQPISLSYQTVGYLELTQRLPEADSREVNPASAVVAAFNRPVVPLGADPSTLPAAFELDPITQGRGEWVNTSTYIFYPEPGLEGGKTYQTIINSSLTGVDGSPLDAANGWSFFTSTPELVSLEPEPGGANLDLDSRFVLTFNQPMDQTSLEAGLRLVDPEGASVSGTYEWDDSGTILTFTPQELLSRDSTYTLEMDGQVRGHGGTPIDQPMSTAYSSVPDLAVVRSEPGQNQVLERYTSVTFDLSAPVSRREAISHISIEPEPANVFISSDETDRRIYLSASFAPSTEYKVTLVPELSDLWGGALGEEYTLNFRSLPLGAGVFIGSGGPYQFLSAQDRGVLAQVSGLDQLDISVGNVPFDDFLLMNGNNGYEYYRSYRPAEPLQWVQELDGDPGQSQQVEIPLARGRNQLDPGIYHLSIDLPNRFDYDVNTLVIVSNINLTIKHNTTEALVWAVDLRDRTPVASAPITLYSSDGTQIATGITDQQGILKASFSTPIQEYTSIIAVSGTPGEDQFAVSDSAWSAGVGAGYFRINSDLRGATNTAYIYTDRPIYRPGQTVYYRVVTRSAFDGRYELMDKDQIDVVFNNSNGEELKTDQLSLSAFGTAHGAFTLSPDAQPGYYSINVPGMDNGWLSFQVANYRKPEIDLQIAFTQQEVLAGQEIQATVNARYYFDAPAGNLPIEWALYSEAAEFPLHPYQTGVDWQAGSDPWSYGYFSTRELDGTAITAPDGTLELNLLPLLSEERKFSTTRYILEVTAFDESGLAVSNRVSLLAHPASIYAGIRPDSWIKPAGKELGFSVMTAGWDQSSIGMQALRAEFYKINWVPNDSYTADPNADVDYKRELTQIASTDFQTDATGQARLAFTPTDPGTYLLRVSGADGDGHPYRSEVTLWVSGPGQAVWPNYSAQRLRMTADRPSYRSGDTAEVMVPNPFPTSSLALVTTELGTIRSHQVLELQPGGNTLSFPLTEDDAPNIYVSVTLFGQDESNQPDFRVGYLTLIVEPIEQTLNVTLTPQPERSGPGETVTFEVMVSDSKGQPVQGEFSLSVVDKAVLALAEPNSRSIVPAFFDTQPLGIRTGLPLSVYAHREVATQEAYGRGGGGGGDGTPPTVREDLPDTAFWQADIVTDANGKALLEIQLPDNLTTWQIETRGLTADTLVGQSQAELVTTKDLLVRPAIPRFLVANDHLVLGAIVHNNSTEELLVDVSLKAEGFKQDAPETAIQKITVPAGSRARVDWWGTVQSVTSADLIFSATARCQSGQVYQDAIRPAKGMLPVNHYLARQSFRTVGTLDESGQRLELVSLPHYYDVAFSNPQVDNLTVDLAPSLASAMMQSLEVLENYPYQCTEQTLSRFLPNLEFHRALQTLGIDSAATQARLDESLEEGLQILISRQNWDGGWGWWSGSPSDPFITAYILIGLSRTEDVGMPNMENIREKAVNYLKQQLTTIKPSVDERVFIHYALAEAGAGNASTLSGLYNARTRLNPWAQALLALSLEKTTPGDERARTMISDLESMAVRSAAGASWDSGEDDRSIMISPLTNNAMVLYALGQRDPGSPLVADAVRYLMANRQADGAWASTFETAWILMAMTEVLKGTGELGGEFSYAALLNGTPVASGQASGSDQLTEVRTTIPLSSLYADSPNLLEIQREEGPGRLYYSALLTASRPAASAPALAQGISISRAYFPAGTSCSGLSCAPVWSAPSNEPIQVRLTLTLPHDMFFLIVEDYIPSGAEILDPSLKTSPLLDPYYIPGPDERISFDPVNPFEDGWGWWYFINPRIYDDHIAWTSDYVPAGTYELVYTLMPVQSGEYQVLPARAWQFYFPEVQGTSPGALFSIER